VRHTNGGFGSKVRGLFRGRAPELAHATEAKVTRLEPAGRNLPEKRSTYEDVGNLLGGRILEIIGAPASSGAKVNENTALNVSAVTASITIRANILAKLPIYLYQDRKGGPQLIETHPASYLVRKSPGQLHTAFELKQLMETGKCLGGNGYGRVYRDEYFQPRAIQWVPPCDVTPKIVKRPNGEMFPVYQVTGQDELLTRSDIIHVRGFCKDGINGMSPIAMQRESIGTSLSQTSAAGNLMRNGAKWPGFITVEGVQNKEQLEAIRDEINANMTGVMNNGRIPVVGGTMKFTQTNGMSMVDAQFLESRRFELQEIARIYGIPAFLIGDTTSSTSWGSGIEQQTLGFLNFFLDPHLVSWEESLDASLLTEDEKRAGFFFKFDREQLANVALEAKASFYQTMRNIGVFSVNDVRAKLEEPLIEGGDDYRQPFNANAAAAKAEEKPTQEPIES
jgi:HK97 family phage portal protein